MVGFGNPFLNIADAFLQVVVHYSMVVVELGDVLKFSLCVFHSFIDDFFGLGAPSGQSLSQNLQRWNVDEKVVAFKAACVHLAASLQIDLQNGDLKLS